MRSLGSKQGIEQGDGPVRVGNSKLLLSTASIQNGLGLCGCFLALSPTKQTLLYFTAVGG
jgi:hypothetical protein